MLTNERIEFLIKTHGEEALRWEVDEVLRLALRGIERDERAERIGRAVLAQEGDETPRDLRGRAEMAERIGYESYGALLRAIADAMEEP